MTHYGLDGHPPALYRQIGAALGLSGERDRQPFDKPRTSYIPRRWSGCATLPIPMYCVVFWTVTRWLITRLPMNWPNAGCGGEEGEVGTNCTPAETRAQDPAFPVMDIAACPFRFPTLIGVSASSYSTISCQPMPGRKIQLHSPIPSPSPSILLSSSTLSPVTLASATKCSWT